MIGDRLAWDPARPVGRAALAYELLVLRRGGARRGAARPHRGRAPRRARPARRRAASSCTSRTPSSSRRTAARGLAAWLRALPLQAARRCAAAAGCAPERADRPRRGDGAAGSRPSRGAWPRLRSYERAGFRKVDPAAAPYAQPDFRPPEVLAGADAAAGAARAGAAPCRARGARRAMPAAEVAAVVEAIYAVYGVHVPAAALDPLRAAAARLDALASRRFRLLPPTRVITAYHHPGFAAPIGDHVMPMRKFQLVADGLAGAPGVRVEAPAPVDARASCCRVHTRRVRRRRAHRRAARARRVAEVPVVAGALAVGAADQRRRAGGGRARARRRRRRRARERLPPLARRPRRGLLHLQRPRRRGRGAARGRARARRVAVLDLDLHYGNGTASLCADAALALQLLDLRQRLLAEHSRTGTSRPCATRTAPTTSRSRCRTAAAARRCSRRSSAAWRRSSRWGRPDLVLYQAGADPYREDPVLAARSRPRRPARARPLGLRVGAARGAAARVGARGRLHAGPLEGRRGTPWHLRRRRRGRTAEAGAR